ncbi:MAG: hypothetical protein HY402_03620 [Elusimicrobia bacterium]|nr:hypothetical protein [Elusimicrobiota bacterium]
MRTPLLVASLLFLPASLRAVPSFTKEADIRLSSAAPQAVTGTFPGTGRFYFVRDNIEIRSASSSNGINFVEESGIRISTFTTPDLDVSSITAASVLGLNAGGFRMLYSAITSTGNFRIYSATSSDGSSWTNETGTRMEVSGGLTYVSSPRLVELSNGDWRLYYIQDKNGGNQIEDRQVFSSLSTNEGLNWTTGVVLVADEAGEVGASVLTNLKIRLYYTSPLSGQTTHTQVLSVLSKDANGNTFDFESGVRLSTGTSDGALSFPFLVRSTESFRWRMYYNFTAPGSTGTPQMLSALTLDPDPQSLSPSTVFRTDSTSTFTLNGEIFSGAPTAKLTKAGESDIPGTSLTRVDDQKITVTFDTQNKTLGLWNLVVTNDDGKSTTLSNALFIDFAPGNVKLTDNLLRPRLGTQTRVDVTVFKAGRVTLRLYTFNGELVATLSDEDRPEGSFTVFWEGRTGQGNTVASGIYLLHALGPKLDAIRKIAVIK